MFRHLNGFFSMATELLYRQYLYTTTAHHNLIGVSKIREKHSIMPFPRIHATKTACVIVKGSHYINGARKWYFGHIPRSQAQQSAHESVGPQTQANLF
ncbi:uncharacterized protein METZ01_LOCUS304618 [marine metagenome]|uniref:Uncharacterized protein n=1 Tax=marine metagenome TaxID=408172 RepID=A0A382MS01_9ZZZZ